MTIRRWTLKLLIELSAVLVAVMVVLAAPAAPASAAPAQDPVVEVDPVLEADPGVEADPAGAADPEPVVEVEPVVDAEPESRSLLTESRKIVAIIGGLVFVALALLLLTIRYWRVTKPIPAAAVPERSEVTAVPARGAVPEELVVAPITSEVPVSVAAADHRPDDTWEPRGTGEHAVVTIAAQPAAARPKSAIARPGRDARQAALARTANGSSGR